MMKRALALALVTALLAPAATVAKPPHSSRTHEPARKSHRVHHVKQPPAHRPGRPVVQPPEPPEPQPKPLARMQVVAREFSLALSRQALPAGRAAIELVNQGQDPHDLRVERADAPSTGFSFALARPHAVASQKLDLTAGEWKLYCTLPGHEALGMSARITVAG
jgi:hypothetical protein